MKTKYDFTLFSLEEFETWLRNTSFSRTITTIQQHHTWKPSYTNFKGDNHFQLQKAMRDYHVNNNGWSDIGQQLTTFPDGTVMTGRSFNRTPACIHGANTNCVCIENLGDFDKNRDQMTDVHRDTIIRVTAALLERFALGTPDSNNIVYHHWHDASGNKLFGKNAVKSCPGTAFFGGNKLSNFTEIFAPLVQKALSTPLQDRILPQQWVAVTADSLTIRSKPSSNVKKANDVEPVEFGSILRVFATQGKWLRISNTKQHWVYSQYTESVRPATVKVKESNIRMGPGLNFDIISVADIGDSVFTRETSGSWSHIGPNQWIHESLIEYA